MDRKKLKKIVICKVNGEEITLEELNDFYEIEIDNFYKENDSYVLTEEDKLNLKHETLNSIIYEKLILSEAKRLKLKVSEDLFQKEKEKFIKKFGTKEEFLIALDDKGLTERDFDESFFNELLIRVFIEKQIKDKIDPYLNDQAIKKYYENNKQFLTPKTKYKIKILSLKENSYNEYKDKILERLQNGEKFESLVKIYSEDPFKNNNGDIGIVELDYFEEIVREQIKNLRIGSFTKFLKVGDYYTMYYLEDVIREKPEPFEKIKELLKEALKEQLYEEEFFKIIDELHDKAEIVYYKENLEKAFKDL